MTLILGKVRFSDFFFYQKIDRSNQINWDVQRTIFFFFFFLESYNNFYGFISSWFFFALPYLFIGGRMTY